MFSQIDGTQTQTGFLWDKTGFADLLDSTILLHTKDVKYAMNSQKWNAYYQAFLFSNVDKNRIATILPSSKGFPKVEKLTKADSNVVAIKILATSYDRIKTTAIDDNLLIVDTTQKIIFDVPNRTENPYKTENLFLASTTHSTIYGKTVFFDFSKDWMVGNLTPQEKDEFLKNIQADFGDCKGDTPIDPKNPTDPIEVTYKEYGFRQIKIKSVLRGQPVQSNTLILITPTVSNYDDPIDPNPPIDPQPGVDPIIDPKFFPPFPPTDLGAAPCSGIDDDDLPTVSGVKGTCEDIVVGNGNGRTGCTEITDDSNIIAAAKWNISVAPRRPFVYNREGSIGNNAVADAYIFLNADNTLNRPVILVHGYTGINNCGYYDVGNVEGNLNLFARNLLNDGYDVIYLDFQFIGNYVENNAAILRELLERVNAAKNLNSEEYGVPIYPNKIIGHSLGGIISRYELALMETENLNHDVDLYACIDSPHKGANVPLGLQYAGFYADEMRENIPPWVNLIIKKQTQKGVTENEPLWNPDEVDGVHNKLSQFSYICLACIFHF